MTETRIIETSIETIPIARFVVDGRLSLPKNDALQWALFGAGFDFCGYLVFGEPFPIMWALLGLYASIDYKLWRDRLLTTECHYETVTEQAPEPVPTITINAGGETRQIPAVASDLVLKGGFRLTGKQVDMLSILRGEFIETHGMGKAKISQDLFDREFFDGGNPKKLYSKMRDGLVGSGYLERLGNSNYFIWTDKEF